MWAGVMMYDCDNFVDVHTASDKKKACRKVFNTMTFLRNDISHVFDKVQFKLIAHKVKT